jgi:hypothetical protein
MLHSVTYVRALFITKTLQGHHAHTEVLSARFLILLFLAILIGHSSKRLMGRQTERSTAALLSRNAIEPWQAAAFSLNDKGKCEIDPLVLT